MFTEDFNHLCQEELENVLSEGIWSSVAGSPDNGSHLRHLQLLAGSFLTEIFFLKRSGLSRP